MDYNDFSERLKKTIKSLNGRFDDDIAVYVTHEKKETFNSDNTKTTKFSFNYSFGKDDTETVINRIFIILYNLASLKDHLKNSFEKQGINGQLVEDEINNSLHLQVIIDIVNQEKHGYPLKRKNRSNKNPLIVGASQVLQMSTAPGVENSVSGSSLTADGIKFFGDGTQQVKIIAEITDGDKNRLFSLDELIETAYKKLLNLATKYNCC
jgi:hypothetical protein